MKIGTQDVDGTVDKVDTGSNKVTVKPTQGGTPFMIDMPAQGQPIVTKAEMTDEEYDRWQEISKMIETATPEYSHVGEFIDKDELIDYLSRRMDAGWWSNVLFDLPITDDEKKELIQERSFMDEFAEKIQKDLVGKADEIAVIDAPTIENGKISVWFAMGRREEEDDMGRPLPYRVENLRY